ncbi:MAG: hypothetical protein A2722_02975 [Candidatus Doudnabacteria bacterium RIFCSPHIGHO2_01_FULL_50_11]|uniref:Type II secretion system protein GspF domain-containing protein n=1 Tax=Candidatus Doudnabacteria bacterium RIFCSPHIGHO2_01_FULL_50_11 TaxID=1817828 RepID=A0A1F5PHZ4_9BACT|nr:MAG: hypothetical protein A2722_02975 [Candidatus Doudnabacteria bacterium RIFCSPHIGHO2_01_FULL_50_11]HLC44426.1 type II secretion system F family protein [Patescibacteria group bacterium]
MEFTYRARTKAGETESGVVASATRQEALLDLRSRGLTPVAISEKRAGWSSFNSIVTSIFSVSLLEKITFLKNLTVMLRAGLSLPRALQILTAQTKRGRFNEILTHVTNDVRSGKALSEAFARYPNEFGPLYISMIQVGESSGGLDKNLEYLVGYLRRDYELMKKTKGALTYPIVVMVALVIVVILMFTFILPKLTATFTELKVDLPFTTRVLIAVVNIFSHYYYLVILGLVGLVVGMRVFSRTSNGRKILHKIYLTMPIIGPAAKKLNLARFTLTLSSLLNSSMPIVEAVKIAGRSMTNMYYARASLRAAEKVKSGTPLSNALEADPKLFPDLMVQMIRVGEESGSVESILNELNVFYEEELDEFIKNLSSIIEPVMVIAIGVVVGFMALALITPIYSISQNA